MPKLTLRFGNSILQEVPVGQSGVRIGRSPDNGLVIDNPAVSSHHARVLPGTSGWLILEDLGSMNGTFVNSQRVKSVTLKPGDCVTIGKHTILAENSRDNYGFLAPRAAVPTLNETVMLGTRERSEFLERIAAEGESTQIAPSRLRVPTLIVRKGKTKQREYTLTDNLTVIGKSAMATVKMRGWFAPKVAAQINRRGNDDYYVGTAGSVPVVNGRPISSPTKLQSGDIIEFARLKLEFLYRD
jgi:pSer/pThr/pTyr-binding forkhead associated (FHA) protein